MGYNKLFSGVPVAKLRSSGYILLTICAQRPDIVKFFETFNMPDTFYSWFLITELHVWLLGSRLMGEGDEGRIVRNSLVETLWRRFFMSMHELQEGDPPLPDPEKLLLLV